MLIAGRALRTMRLVNNATSNYHVDAQRSCAAREPQVCIASSGFFRTWDESHRLNAIDAASDTI
jgi:hypothetical protein